MIGQGVKSAQLDVHHLGTLADVWKAIVEISDAVAGAAPVGVLVLEGLLLENPVSSRVRELVSDLEQIERSVLLVVVFVVVVVLAVDLLVRQPVEQLVVGALLLGLDPRLPEPSGLELHNQSRREAGIGSLRDQPLSQLGVVGLTVLVAGHRGERIRATQPQLVSLRKDPNSTRAHRSVESLVHKERPFSIGVERRLAN
jgi:hypothetical protein